MQHPSGVRATALRRGLADDAVMATAGASARGATRGLPALVAPFFALAVVQALYVPALGAWRHRTELRLGW